MKILSQNEINYDAWENFFRTNKFVTPFQSKSFYDFINSVAGFKAYVYAVEENNSLQALCVVTLQKEAGIKSFFSKRAIIYGGPLLSDNKVAAAELLKYISEQIKQVIYIETRNLHDYSQYKPEFVSAGWKYEPHLNYHLDCSDEETVWKNLNNNRRRQIKKAIKLGAVTIEAKTEEDVKKFYGILKNLYADKVKKPFFPLDFFLKFIKTGFGKIFLVKLENEVIGGIACPFLNAETIYELYVCGLDQQYKDYSPSVMATYAGIEFGCKNKMKRFDFMGAGKPENDYGVREFKEKFGGELVEHGRFIRINKPLLYRLGRTVISAASRKKGKQS